MTIYTASGIGDVWTRAGGDLQWARKAEAVALAESGGNSAAISRSFDYGLWQINQVHFGDGIIDIYNWMTPIVNARAAISISANGTNWAAWCTAWTDPARDCGHGYLPTPQAGSPAGNELARLGGSPAAQLTSVVNLAPVQQRPTPHRTNLERGWAQMQQNANGDFKSLVARMIAAETAIKGA